MPIIKNNEAKEDNYRNGTQEYVEYEIMSREKFRYYPNSGKIYPVKGSYTSWNPDQKKTNYEDIAKKKEKAEENKKIENDLINKQIENEKYVNEGTEER